MNMNIIAQLITKWRKNMNNKKEKTMFSIETLDDGSGLNVKSKGHQVAIGFMIAIGLVKYFDQEDTVLNIDDFITILKKAVEDSEYIELIFQAISLYADNQPDGLKAFAMLMGVAANIERMKSKKMN